MNKYKNALIIANQVGFQFNILKLWFHKQTVFLVFRPIESILGVTLKGSITWQIDWLGQPISFAHIYCEVWSGRRPIVRKALFCIVNCYVNEASDAFPDSHRVQGFVNVYYTLRLISNFRLPKYNCRYNSVDKFLF